MNITLYSLTDYNNGDLIPFTIELDDIDNEKEFLAEIAENLKRITEEKNDGDIREEWIVCDYDDIPPVFVGEYTLDPEFFAWKEAAAASICDISVFEAAIDCCVPYSDVEEAYQGEYDSDSEFAESLLEYYGEIPVLPGYMHIDWERTAKDIMMDYCESSCYYFRRL